MSEYRPGGFQYLPPVVKNLLIINVLVFLVLNLTGSSMQEYILRNFALYNWESPFFKPWQLVTHMFIHEEIFHVFFNMFALWMFGNVMENVMGPKIFLSFYLICGIGAAVFYLGIQTFTGIDIDSLSYGASGAIYGILFAYGYLFPNAMIAVSFILPMKAKYAVALFAGIELVSAIMNKPGDTVGHFAHLGGMLVAFLFLFIWKKTRRNSYL